ENGWRWNHSPADERRDPGSPDAGTVARESRSGGAREAQRLPSDETIADLADVADFRCARHGNQLSAPRELHCGSASSGIDEQRLQWCAGGAVRIAGSKAGW